MWPKLIIHRNKLKENALRVKKELEKLSIETTFVTKIFSGNVSLFDFLDEAGFHYFGDSRIENLKKMQSLKTPKMLLRIPMIQEIKELTRWAQASLHSSYETVRLVSQYNEKDPHKIYLMIDVGDLREGYICEEELFTDVEKIVKLKNICLEGIGTNLTCFAGVLPDKENMQVLVEMKEKLERTFSIELKQISGGNSSSLWWAKKGYLPKEITELRIGEAILLGHETAYFEPVFDLHRDVFTLEAVLVEVKEKPFTPWGNRGKNAFDEKTLEREGKGLRGIVALGKTDVDNSLRPLNPKMQILGASSDHLIVELAGDEKYAVGDVVGFSPGYSSLMRLFLSPFVEKVLL